MKPKNYWLEKWKQYRCVNTENSHCNSIIDCEICDYYYNYKLIGFGGKYEPT